MFQDATIDNPESASPFPVAFCALETDDSAEVLAFVAEAASAGEPCALVTLVDVSGGASRAPGAQMGVRADGGYCGFISGGCLEAACAAEALQAIAAGRDRLIRFGEGSDYFDIALPCGGGIRLAVHVVRDTGPIQAVLTRLAMRKPAALTYDSAHERLQSGIGKETGWEGRHFSISYRPSLKILLVGNGIEAKTFARLARAAKFEVEVGEAVSDIQSADRDTAIVMLRHDIESEIDLLVQALRTDAFYIGCLGGRRTHMRRADRLRDAGISKKDIANIRAPIGLFGPARDATAIAVSALAEITQLRSTDA